MFRRLAAAFVASAALIIGGLTLFVGSAHADPIVTEYVNSGNVIDNSSATGCNNTDSLTWVFVVRDSDTFVSGVAEFSTGDVALQVGVGGNGTAKFASATPGSAAILQGGYATVDENGGAVREQDNIFELTHCSAAPESTPTPTPTPSDSPTPTATPTPTPTPTATPYPSPTPGPCGDQPCASGLSESASCDGTLTVTFIAGIGQDAPVLPDQLVVDGTTVVPVTTNPSISGPYSVGDHSFTAEGFPGPSEDGSWPFTVTACATPTPTPTATPTPTPTPVTTPTPTPPSTPTPLTGAGIDGNIGIPMIGLGALLGAVALFGLVRGRKEDI